uniref:Uncharacterized protein n=1 Tax=Panagrolaimus sp. ES5 TaxID=591445 RepID=A0AC34FQQ3_9BILA
MVSVEGFRYPLDSTYAKILTEVKQSVHSLVHLFNNDHQEVFSGAIKNVFQQFAETLIMPKNCWDLFIRTTQMNYDHTEELDVMLWAFDHFYYVKDNRRFHLAGQCDPKYKKVVHLLDFCYTDFAESYQLPPAYIEENFLAYPHDYLQQIFHKYEKSLNCPPSCEIIKKYEALKKLYDKLKQYPSNWFQLLLQVDHHKFLCNNVEYRLGSDLSDKNLWKQYIDYLKEKEPKKMLVILSKYCRFFLDDSEMKERYRKEMLEHGPVELSWKHLFDFERGCLKGVDNFKMKSENVNETSENETSSGDNSEDESSTYESSENGILEDKSSENGISEDESSENGI